MKFAKLFDTKDGGQVLIRKELNDKQEEIIRITTEADSPESFFDGKMKWTKKDFDSFNQTMAEDFRGYALNTLTYYSDLYFDIFFI